MNRERSLNRIRSLIMILGHRQVGHTTLLRDGVKNYDRPFAVIAHDTDFANHLLIGSKAGLGKAFSMNSLSNHINSIIGSQLPIAIDHATLVNELGLVLSLVEDSISNDDAEKMVKEAVNKSKEFQSDVIKALMDMSEIYQERTINIEALAMDYALCPWWRFSKKSKIKIKILHMIRENNTDPRLPSIFESIRDQVSK